MLRKIEMQRLELVAILHVLRDRQQVLNLGQNE
jgi:hypothetical protein